MFFVNKVRMILIFKENIFKEVREEWFLVVEYLYM